MKFSDDIIHGLGVAFNEADVLGVEFSEQKRGVACTFATISIDKNGNVPSDRRVQVILQPVGRIIASLRLGNWNDPTAEVVIFEPTELLEKVQSFGGLPIYGWEFINNADKDTADWKNRLSFDWTSDQSGGLTNTFDLFQEGHERHLDLRIWFDELTIFNPEGERVELQDFIDAGQRGWDAIYSGDDKTKGFGIFPAK